MHINYYPFSYLSHVLCFDLYKRKRKPCLVSIRNTGLYCNFIRHQVLLWLQAFADTFKRCDHFQNSRIWYHGIFSMETLLKCSIKLIKAFVIFSCFQFRFGVNSHVKSDNKAILDSVICAANRKGTKIVQQNWRWFPLCILFIFVWSATHRIYKSRLCLPRTDLFYCNVYMYNVNVKL